MSFRSCIFRIVLPACPSNWLALAGISEKLMFSLPMLHEEDRETMRANSNIYTHIHGRVAADILRAHAHA
jgi:hypothetical protein